MKNKHRIKQGLSLLLAGGIALTNLGAALPAFAEDAAATPETASAATPETAEANVPTPNLSQITENLYDDLPDAPTGSYLGSMGLPVATGETKIGISAWVSDLYDGVDAHMDASATIRRRIHQYDNLLERHITQGIIDAMNLARGEITVRIKSVSARRPSRGSGLPPSRCNGCGW